VRLIKKTGRTVKLKVFLDPSIGRDLGDYEAILGDAFSYEVDIMIVDKLPHFDQLVHSTPSGYDDSDLSESEDEEMLELEGDE